MKIRVLTAIVLLLSTACQHGGSSPAIRVPAAPAPVRLQEATSTINIVTLVVSTPKLIETQNQQKTSPTVTPATSAEAVTVGDRPLIMPRILRAEYTEQVTRLIVGLDIHPVYRSLSGVSGEIIDATLHDDTGREIPGISSEMSQPDQVILDFAPLPLGTDKLTLRAQLSLHGVPAIAPFTIDVSRHNLDQSWSIQAKIHFGKAVVGLHTARLSRYEVGAPDATRQQLRLELWGENAELDGAQLLCLYLSPLPPQAEGGMSCGQEPDGISATVDLGPAVQRSAPLPMPAGLVILQASADFLLPGYWVTTWPVER